MEVTLPLVGKICRRGFHLVINRLMNFSQKIKVMDLQQSDNVLPFLEKSPYFRQSFG